MNMKIAVIIRAVVFIPCCPSKGKVFAITPFINAFEVFSASEPASLIMLRIRYAYPGSKFLFPRPDPGSKRYQIFLHTKNLISFNKKNVTKLSEISS
jgi:hypothetical protein